MKCTCCGSAALTTGDVLWPELVAEWGIGPDEVAYINRQQGLRCTACGNSLRVMALARALMACHDYRGTFKDFVRTRAIRKLRVLEVNPAGDLTTFLREMAGHVLGCFPDVDMQRLPYADGSFDWVLHSDTLEHVPDPVRGLAECRRVLRPGGLCAFTVPIIVGRLTVSREGKPPSYHGSPANPLDCLVRTEYGADAWRHVVMAGFTECRIFPMDHPAAHALVGVRRDD